MHTMKFLRILIAGSIFCVFTAILTFKIVEGKAQANLPFNKTFEPAAGEELRLSRQDPIESRSPEQPTVADANVELLEVSLEPLELTPMELSRIKRQDVVADIRITGSLQPLRRTTLNAKVAGTIAEVLGDVGDEVQAGGIIARFDDADLKTVIAERRATFEATAAQLAAAQAQYNRVQTLASRGVASQANLEQTESELMRLRAQQRALQAQIAMSEKSANDAVIRAEFNGTISRRLIEEGQTVGQNQQLFDVVDLSELEVAAGIPANRIWDVSIGQTAHLTIDGLVNHTFEARVKRISPLAAAGSRTITVYFGIDNRDNLLKGGMFATGSLVLRRSRNALVLPTIALRKDHDATFVLKVHEGRAVRQNVQTGGSWDDGRLVEIAAGLKEGDLIVTAPLPDLKPGAAVRIVDL